MSLHKESRRTRVTDKVGEPALQENLSFTDRIRRTRVYR